MQKNVENSAFKIQYKLHYLKAKSKNITSGLTFFILNTTLEYYLIGGTPIYT